MMNRRSAGRAASSIGNACVALALLLGVSACAAGRGRAERDRILTCPLERVGTVKNFSGKAVDVIAFRYPFEGQRRYEFLGSVTPGETKEFVLADSVLLSVSDPTAQPVDVEKGPVIGTRPVGNNVHAQIARGGGIEVKYFCRRFGEGPPGDF